MKRVMHDSVPPANMKSARFSATVSYADPILCVPEAQADTIE
jgi:hypothetical protein